MSVNHNYFSIDWKKIPELNEKGNFDYIFELMEEETPEWIGDVPFGDQIGDYLFSSWNGLMSFKDWFKPARDFMDPILVAQFTSVYQDIGLLMNDNYSYVPIKKDIIFEDDWLLGAIPPRDVTDLHARSERIDLKLLTSEFQKALDRKPLDLLQNGESVRDWLLAVQEGLRGVKNKNFGIIVGAA